MANCTYIDGVGSSQAIDTAGEIVGLPGLDCSSLIGGAFNYEHKSDLPQQIVGKVLDYKKIFSEKDCDNERHLYYWNKCKIPFLYVMGRLFDDKKDSSKEIAALFLDDAENRHEPQMVGFSVEGSKISKEAMTITRSIARKITITHMPANKTCVAEALPSSKENDVDSLFKGEIEFFNPNQSYLEFLEKKESDMKDLHKEVGTGNGAFIGDQMAMSENMLKSLPQWSSGKQSGDSVHFNHPEHGTVSIHKQPSGEFHVKHQGSMAGLKGQAGSFKDAASAGKHAKDYMSAVSDKKILAPKMHNRASPNMVGKFTLGKALEAGSGLAAPSELTQGAALAKEDIKKGVPSFGQFNHKQKKDPSEKENSSMVSMSNTSINGVSAGSGFGVSSSLARSEKKKKSAWLMRAEQAYDKWEKKEQFRSFMRKSMPNLALGEIDAIGQTIALRKSIEAENNLSKIAESYEEDK